MYNSNDHLLYILVWLMSQDWSDSVKKFQLHQQSAMKEKFFNSISKMERERKEKGKMVLFLYHKKW
jgi:hypothetical protein